MIEAGHADAMDYGWSFFIMALEIHEKIKKEFICNMAIAVRTGHHADKNEWRKFVKRMTPKG